MLPSRETSVVAAASCVVVVLAVLLHHESALRLSRFLARRTVPPRPRIPVPVSGLPAARMAGIRLPAPAARALLGAAGVGELNGHGGAVGLPDVVCVSATATTHTPLGDGDVVPVGSLRCLFGMEAPAGLFLVTWPASRGFLEMQRHWREDHAPDGADGVSGRDEAVVRRGAPAGDEGRRP